MGGDRLEGADHLLVHEAFDLATRGRPRTPPRPGPGHRSAPLEAPAPSLPPGPFTRPPRGGPGPPPRPGPGHRPPRRSTTLGDRRSPIPAETATSGMSMSRKVQLIRHSPDTTVASTPATT